MSGETASLLVAIVWTFTALMFERAAKIFGSLALNPLRLLMAFCFLSVFSFFVYGNPFPVGVEASSWMWLSLSGFVGFFIGDYFLFKAFEIIGSRISMLIMSLAPVISAFIGYLVLDEILSITDILAVLIIIIGISLAVLTKKNGERIKIHHPLGGIIFAVIGACSQGAGLILAKIGMNNINAVNVTQCRVIAGFISFTLVLIFSGRLKKSVLSYRNQSGLLYASMGSFLGPFAGVSLSMYAISKTEVGVASAIMSIVPVLLIPVSFVFEKKKVRIAEILGIILAVSGVIILFLM
ncbi:MAG TPA: DMT family transporter [Spirochaetota bacterium]|nr:DMT family transporter [Spirochaetota bacterium]HOU83633.1 DMT family transporter [Spirochaetota bacterium]HPK56712.1 DMT family transporter [Spirochaetota bacterium]